MSKNKAGDVSDLLSRMQAQIEELTKRIEHYEPVAATAGITEHELIAISAVIGAYLGVRAHIRQIRLVSTNAWAQQGRVSIQASHKLQG